MEQTPIRIINTQWLIVLSLHQIICKFHKVIIAHP